MTLRFYELMEAKHRIHNPFTDEKLMLLGELCRLQPGMRQLDLACGSGEMLCRWAAQHGTGGTGVDISTVFLDAARRRAESLGVQDRVNFVQADAAEYRAEAKAYDIVSCMGATWIGGGTLGTLALMQPALKDSPDALLLLGEVYWRETPTDAACEALGYERDALVDLGGMPDRFAEGGYELVEMVVAEPDEWDRYQGQGWWQAHHWLREHPDDADAPAFAQWVEDNKRAYLKYERRYFGWAAFVLKVR